MAQATSRVSVVPSYARPRSRPYDAVTDLYGSDVARRNTRRALGFESGSARSGIQDVLICGDSFSAGWKATTVGGTQTTPGDDWATILKAQLAGAGYPVTGGYVFAGSGFPSGGDARWTFTGSWTRSDTASNYAFSAATAGLTATFTSTDVGTVLEFCVIDGSAHTVHYTIDGGADRTFTSVVGTKLISVTGLTLGFHSVTITTPAAAVFWVVGARVRQTTGLSISNAGIYGSHTDDWLPTAKNTAGAGGTDISFLNPYKLPVTCLGAQPKLVLACLGGNDALHSGHTLSGMSANLQTIVNAYQTAGSVVLQRIPTYFSTAGLGVAVAGSPLATGTSWDAFLSAMYDCSDTYDTALVDHSYALGDPNTLETAGLMFSDHVHLLTPGQAGVASHDFRALVGV